ncbi:chorismate mutase [Rivularia sp. UHCC 0363]|uniref:chorismate mutase n=1 Tax=Rivularia sp. UHCC 0363 TaxID=3110244 RepID=UPI002B21C257|nr:chorismate mutase [Rivularia sp. UHCC 0363]MEA5594371.1 chorismate mutase [Rivularia sp. UHCC 0363]
MQAIRGATTVSENTVEAMQEVVMELLDELEKRNQLHPTDMISVTFSVTSDLDAIFPAAIARHRPHWDNVSMIDVQQMYVPGSLEKCIRILVHAYIKSNTTISHIYLRHAAQLRPDWNLPQPLQASQSTIESKV